MSSIDNLFQAKSTLASSGVGTFFSVDKKTRGDDVAYLRDNNNDIVGFTFQGKHAFLENVQKDSSGALFKTARYPIPTEDVDKIIDVFFDYSNKKGNKLYKSEQHLFVQVKDKKATFLDKIKGKKPKTDQKIKFKKINPFVDLADAKPEKTSHNIMRRLVATNKIWTEDSPKKSKSKNKVSEFKQSDIEDIDNIEKPKTKTKTKKPKIDKVFEFKQSDIEEIDDVEKPKTKTKTKKTKIYKVPEFKHDDIGDIEPEKKSSKKSKKRS